MVDTSVFSRPLKNRRVSLSWFDSTSLVWQFYCCFNHQWKKIPTLRTFQMLLDPTKQRLSWNQWWTPVTPWASWAPLSAWLHMLRCAICQTCECSSATGEAKAHLDFTVWCAEPGKQPMEMSWMLGWWHNATLSESVCVRLFYRVSCCSRITQRFIDKHYNISSRADADLVWVCLAQLWIGCSMQQ